MTLMFYAHSNIILTGISQSGKTTLVLEIIKHKLITPWPKEIIYCYGVRQEWMLHWNKQKDNPHIKFIDGLNIDDVKKGNSDKLLILDDLMTSALKKEICDLFVYGSHHYCVTTIFITCRQNTSMPSSSINGQESWDADPTPALIFRAWAASMTRDSWKSPPP